MTTASDVLAQARGRLAESPRERLGDWAHSRKLLGFGRAPRIVPVGEAWRVGVLLITDTGALSVGEVVRARQEAQRGFTAESQRERSDRMAAAFRGGFAEGEAVHIGWTEIDVVAVDHGATSGVLSMQGGEPHIQWSAAGVPRLLAAYLNEQIDLR